MLTSYAASFRADSNPAVSVSEIRNYTGEPKLTISDDYQNITLMFKNGDQLRLLRDAIDAYFGKPAERELRGSPVTRGELD